MEFKKHTKYTFDGMCKKYPWLEQIDWLLPAHSEDCAYCSACGKTFKIGDIEIHAVIQHEKGKRHIERIASEEALEVSTLCYRYPKNWKEHKENMVVSLHMGSSSPSVAGTSKDTMKDSNPSFYNQSCESPKGSNMPVLKENNGMENISGESMVGPSTGIISCAEKPPKDSSMSVFEERNSVENVPVERMFDPSTSVANGAEEPPKDSNMSVLKERNSMKNVSAERVFNQFKDITISAKEPHKNSNITVLKERNSMKNVSAERMFDPSTNITSSAEEPPKNSNMSVLKERNSMENVPAESMIELTNPVTNITSTVEATSNQYNVNLSQNNLLERKSSLESSLNIQITSVYSLNSETGIGDEISTEEIPNSNNFPNGIRRSSVFENYSEYEKFTNKNSNAGKRAENKSDEYIPDEKIRTFSNGKKSKFIQTPQKRREAHVNPDVISEKVTSDNCMKRKIIKTNKYSQTSSAEKETVHRKKDKSEKSNEKSDANQVTSKKRTSDEKNEKINHDTSTKRRKIETNKYSEVSTHAKEIVHSDDDKFKKPLGNSVISPKNTSYPKSGKINQDNLMKPEKSDINKYNRASSSAEEIVELCNENKSEKLNEKSGANQVTNPKKRTSDQKNGNINHDSSAKRKKIETHKYCEASSTAEEITLHQNKDKFRKPLRNTISPKKTSHSKNEKTNQNKEKSETNKYNQASSSTEETVVHSNKDKSEKPNEKFNANQITNPERITCDQKNEKINRENPVKRKEFEANKNSLASAEEITSHQNEDKFKKPEKEIKLHAKSDINRKEIMSDTENDKLNQANAMKRKGIERNDYSQSSSSTKDVTLHYNEDKSKKPHRNPVISPEEVTSNSKNDEINNSNLKKKKTEINKFTGASSSVKEIAMHSDDNKSKKREEKKKAHANKYICSERIYGSENKKMSEVNPSIRKTLVIKKVSEASPSRKDTTVHSNEDKSPEKVVKKGNTHTNTSSSKQVASDRKNEALSGDYSENEAYRDHLSTLGDCFFTSTHSIKKALSLKKKPAIQPESKHSKSIKDRKTSVETEVESCAPSCSSEPDCNPNTAGRQLCNPNVDVAMKNVLDHFSRSKQLFDEDCLNILREFMNFLDGLDTSTFDFIDSVYEKISSEDGCSKKCIKVILTLFSQINDHPDFLDKMLFLMAGGFHETN